MIWKTLELTRMKLEIFELSLKFDRIDVNVLILKLNYNVKLQRLNFKGLFIKEALDVPRCPSKWELFFNL